MNSFRKTGMCSSQRSTFKLDRASGFTLLEVLLAITITGFILAAASTMIVSVSNIWSSRQESNFFEDHVDGVAEFIQSCFTNAGTEVALSDSGSPSGTEANGDNEEATEDGDDSSNPLPRTTPVVDDSRKKPNQDSSGGSLLRRSDEPIGWAEPPGFAGYRDPLINFKLKDNPPLLINKDNAPAMGIDAFLYFDRDEGLSMLWYSILQEEVENENDLRRTQISPYVKAIRYIYWDERFERWEEEEQPQEGEEEDYLLPRFIKLIFEKDDATKERTIAIPVPSRSAILF